MSYYMTRGTVHCRLQLARRVHARARSYLNIEGKDSTAHNSSPTWQPRMLNGQHDKVDEHIALSESHSLHYASARGDRVRGRMPREEVVIVARHLIGALGSPTTASRGTVPSHLPEACHARPMVRVRDVYRFAEARSSPSTTQRAMDKCPMSHIWITQVSLGCREMALSY